MSKNNGFIPGGRLIPPGKIVTPAQEILGKFRMSVALPFEMLGYQVRFREAMVDETGKECLGEKAARVLRVQAGDPWSGLSVAVAVPVDQILVAPDLRPVAQEVIRGLREGIGRGCRAQAAQAKWFARLIESKRGEKLYARFRAWLERRKATKEAGHV